MTFDYDLATVILSTHFELNSEVKTIPLANGPSTYEGEPVIVSGYGAISEGNNVINHLQPLLTALQLAILQIISVSANER